MNKKELIDLDEDFIVLAVPTNTVEVTIEATIFINGKLERVAKTMDFAEVKAAFKEAEDGYIPSDAVFTLAPTKEEKITDLVRKYLEEVSE